MTSRHLLVALLLALQALACWVGRGPSLAGNVDLRSFYAAGVIVRHHQAGHLYDYEIMRQTQDRIVSPRPAALPFLYPPFASALFLPLAFMSYKTAFAVSLLVNLALLFLAAKLLLLSCDHGCRSLTVTKLAALGGCLFAVPLVFMQGQISLVLLVLLAAANLLLRRQRPLAAGLLLSLMLIKFQLALPILLLFVLWRRWRVAAGFTLGALLLAGGSFLPVGTQGMLSYTRSLTEITRQGSADAFAARARFGMFPTGMPNLHGLCFALAHGARWSTGLEVLLGLLVLGWAARQRASLAVAVPAAMLVSHHLQPHDLTLLLLPLAALSHARHRLVTITICMLTLPVHGLLLAHGAGFVECFAVAAVLLLAGTEQKPGAAFIARLLPAIRGSKTAFGLSCRAGL